MGSNGIRDYGFTRRSVLYGTTTALLIGGVAIALWPAIDQMNPGASAIREALDVDLSGIQTGQSLTIRWRGKPIFIRHRTLDEIQQAKNTPISDLRDVDARLLGAAKPLPATDDNRTRGGKGNWLVVIGVCTREACILKGQNPDEERGNYGGWICPCCASHYDTAGRVRSGVAPANLAVPPYLLTGDAKITLG